MPQWDFWLARVALLQFLASNPPPSLADRQTDRPAVAPPARAGLALGSHVGGNNRDRVVLRPPPCANVQMTRDESVRDPKPRNGAVNALVPGCPLAGWLTGGLAGGPLPPLHCLLAAHDASFECDANEIPFSFQVLRCVRVARPTDGRRDGDRRGPRPGGRGRGLPSVASALACIQRVRQFWYDANRFH